MLEAMLINALALAVMMALLARAAARIGVTAAGSAASAARP